MDTPVWPDQRTVSQPVDKTSWPRKGPGDCFPPESSRNRAEKKVLGLEEQDARGDHFAGLDEAAGTPL